MASAPPFEKPTICRGVPAFVIFVASRTARRARDGSAWLAAREGLAVALVDPIRPRPRLEGLSPRLHRWLAGQGWQVFAVDRDFEAISGLQGVAGVRAETMDLEGERWPLAGSCFADSPARTPSTLAPLISTRLVAALPTRFSISAFGRPDNFRAKPMLSATVMCGYRA